MSAGSKSRLAKAAGAEVAAQSRQEKLHAAVARSTFQVKMYKIARVRTACGSCDVEKWHAAVARSTFGSQNAKKLTVRAHFKKNGKPLWREAHLQVKMQKTPQRRSVFGSWAVENLHAAVARSTFPSQNVKNMRCSGHFLKCGCRKIAVKWHAAVAPSKFASQTAQTTCVLHNF